MQKKSGRGKQRRAKKAAAITTTTAAPQVTTTTIAAAAAPKLQPCWYGVPVAVIAGVWCLFLLLSSSFSHSYYQEPESFSHGQVRQPWLSVFWSGEASTEESSQAFPGPPDLGLPQCPLITEDSKFFGSEDYCDEHNSAEWFVGPPSTSEKLVESRGIHIETKADQGFQASKSRQSDDEATGADSFIDSGDRKVVQVKTLDEYRRSVVAGKQQEHSNYYNADNGFVAGGHVHHHQNRDDSYNFADGAHGAKVVKANKDAKGAGNLLVPDKDKYLRNPCSSEDKFIVIELAEETLVDTVVLGNYEFHSSNVKRFEILGSPEVYPPTDNNWLPLGTFEAENVRHAQTFQLAEPKWVRCLLLRLISHYGSEFYCTLSVFQVHGVDAIEHLLEEWMVGGEDTDAAAALLKNSKAQQTPKNARAAADKLPTNPKTLNPSSPPTSQALPPSPASGYNVRSIDSLLFEPLTPPKETAAETVQVTESETGREVIGKSSSNKEEGVKSMSGNAAHEEGWLHVSGRPSGESVLKITLQKVRLLEIGQSVRDRYLDELNAKYQQMIVDLDQDLSTVTTRLRDETATAASLAVRLKEMELQRDRDIAALEVKMASDFNALRSEMEILRLRIQHMQHCATVATTVALLCTLICPMLYFALKYNKYIVNPRTFSGFHSGVQISPNSTRYLSQIRKIKPLLTRSFSQVTQAMPRLSRSLSQP